MLQVIIAASCIALISATPPLTGYSTSGGIRGYDYSGSNYLTGKSSHDVGTSYLADSSGYPAPDPRYSSADTDQVDSGSASSYYKTKYGNDNVNSIRTYSVPESQTTTNHYSSLSENVSSNVGTNFRDYSPSHQSSTYFADSTNSNAGAPATAADHSGSHFAETHTAQAHSTYSPSSTNTHSEYSAPQSEASSSLSGYTSSDYPGTHSGNHPAGHTGTHFRTIPSASFGEYVTGPRGAFPSGHGHAARYPTPGVYGLPDTYKTYSGSGPYVLGKYQPKNHVYPSASTLQATRVYSPSSSAYQSPTMLGGSLSAIAQMGNGNYYYNQQPNAGYSKSYSTRLMPGQFGGGGGKIVVIRDNTAIYNSPEGIAYSPSASTSTGTFKSKAGYTAGQGSYYTAPTSTYMGGYPTSSIRGSYSRPGGFGGSVGSFLGFS